MQPSKAMLAACLRSISTSWMATTHTWSVVLRLYGSTVRSRPVQNPSTTSAKLPNSTQVQMPVLEPMVVGAPRGARLRARARHVGP